jgi:hypothetical protein
MNIPRANIPRTRAVLAMSALMVLAMVQTALPQARSMDLEFSPDELTGADQNLGRLQKEQPQLFQQILKDVNSDPNARDPATAKDLASASPALDDLNRSSPEALLGLFLLLKSAAKPDGKGNR